MSEINLNEGYAPSMAENGKFARVTTEQLSALGMTESTMASSFGRWAQLVYTINNGTTISELPSSSKVLPNTRSKHKSTLSNSMTAIELPGNTQLIEIWNEGPQSIYFDYANVSTFAELSADGMVLPSESFYSIEVSTDYLSVGSVSAVARIFNHYNV